MGRQIDSARLWPTKTIDRLAKRPHTPGYYDGPSYNKELTRESMKAGIREADKVLRALKRKHEFKSPNKRRESWQSWSRKLAINCERPMRYRAPGETEWTVLAGKTAVIFLEQVARERA